MSRAAWAAIRAAFGQQAVPEPDVRSAERGVSAVLLALSEAPDSLGPQLLFTRRTRSLRSHPGEVSFPGGRLEPGESPREAALREAFEEVGLEPGEVEVLGHLTDFLTFQGVLVCAYVGVVRNADAVPLAPRSLEEVDEVFHVPVAQLLDPARYEARAMPEMRHGRRVHYWHVPRHTIWGITGELTARYLARAHGWVPPVAPRRVSSPEEFLPRPRA